MQKNGRGGGGVSAGNPAGTTLPGPTGPDVYGGGIGSGVGELGPPVLPPNGDDGGGPIHNPIDPVFPGPMKHRGGGGGGQGLHGLGHRVAQITGPGASADLGGLDYGVDMSAPYQDQVNDIYGAPTAKVAPASAPGMPGTLDPNSWGAKIAPKYNQGMQIWDDAGGGLAGLKARRLSGL